VRHGQLVGRVTPREGFINQAIFEAIWVSHEDVERSQLTTPFDQLRILSEATRIVEQAAAQYEAEDPTERLKGAQNGQSSRPQGESRALALGSIMTSMVEPTEVNANRSARLSGGRMSLDEAAQTRKQRATTAACSTALRSR
jgi:hypothetical protein